MNSAEYEGKWSLASVRKELNSTLPDFILEAPYEVRDGGYGDAVIAKCTAVKQFKKDKKFRKLKFRSRKDKNQSILIPKKSINTKGFYISHLGKMKTKEDISRPSCNSRLSWDKHTDKYHLCLVNGFTLGKHKEKKEDGKHPFIALDPGSRTFLSGYYGTGICEFGKKDIARIYRLNLHSDNLKSKMATLGARKRYRLRKAVRRLQERTKNIMDECHKKIANFLCKNFQNVIIPEFSTKQISQTSIHKRVKRNLFSWSHYAFRQRLMSKAIELGTTVRFVNESYTTKTCTRCGWQHPNMGAKKVFKCGGCHLKIDRDLNGARNIMLRALLDRPL